MTGDGVDSQMDEVAERAAQMGVSGTGDNSPPDDGENDPTGEAPESTSTPPDTSVSSMLSGVSDHTYPNPDKDQRSLAEVYEKTNIFLSPAVADAVNELWTDIEYEWQKTHDTELEKNWDFYMALFRVVLNNEDLLRDELGMDSTPD